MYRILKKPKKSNCKMITVEHWKLFLRLINITEFDSFTINYTTTFLVLTEKKLKKRKF
jgi:hypothetical protein